MIDGLPINTGGGFRTSFFTIALTSLFWRRLAIISQSLFDLALFDGNEMYSVSINSIMIKQIVIYNDVDRYEVTRAHFLF